MMMPSIPPSGMGAAHAVGDIAPARPKRQRDAPTPTVKELRETFFGPARFNETPSVKRARQTMADAMDSMEELLGTLPPGLPPREDQQPIQSAAAVHAALRELGNAREAAAKAFQAMEVCYA